MARQPYFYEPPKEKFVYADKDGEFKMHYNEKYDLDEFEGKSFTGYDFVATKELMENIENLPDEQKEVIMLFYFEDLTIKEIASDLKVSENTVKSRLKYAKEKLKSWIQTED